MCIWSQIRKSDVEVLIIVLLAVLSQKPYCDCCKDDVFELIAAYWNPVIMNYLHIYVEG